MIIIRGRELVGMAGHHRESFFLPLIEVFVEFFWGIVEFIPISLFSVSFPLPLPFISS